MILITIGFILILVSSTLNLIFGSRALCCGLWCYVGRKPGDPNKLKVLGLYNELRGTHATGICVDDQVYKAAIPCKEFLPKNAGIMDFSLFNIQNTAFLGHCRQATFHFNKDFDHFAHPHKTNLNDKDFLRLIHNGTLTNFQDLSKKYELPTENRTDSMLLAHVLTVGWESENMDILKEYEGSATVIFYPISSKNTLYVHRDKERELFYWNESKEACYISSIPAALMAIGARKEDIKEFEHGKLVKILNGKITKTWDLTDKKPYSHPRPAAVKKPNHVYANVTYPSKETPKKEGFYIEAHIVKNNGHALTGDFYVHNTTNKAENSVKKQERANYTQYYAVMGVIMKDKENYEKLFSICSEDKNNTKFDAGKFKELRASDICEFAMFPVLGKIWTNNTDQVFWYPGLYNKVKDNAVYEWTLPISGTTYAINRGGMLQWEKETNSDEDYVNIVKKLVEDKSERLEYFDNVQDLFTDFKRELQFSGLAYNFDTFVDHLVEVFERGKYISSSSIKDLNRLRSVEYISGMSDEGDGWSLMHKISMMLKSHQQGLQSMYAADRNEEVIEYDVADTSTESAYFASQKFRDDAMFGDYQSLQDLMENFLPTDNDGNKRSLLLGVASMMKDIGLMTDSDLFDFKQKRTDTIHLQLARVFDELKDNSVTKKVIELFSGDNIEKDFADLYGEYLDLDCKLNRNSKEDVRFEIIKLALSYIQSKASKTLNKEKLLKTYNISEKELEQLA